MHYAIKERHLQGTTAVYNRIKPLRVNHTQILWHMYCKSIIYELVLGRYWVNKQQQAQP